MGWFNKTKKEEVKFSNLPDLPRLPELPSLNRDFSREPLPQLPSFPTDSFSEKFSQNAIKHAVAGEKEEEDFDEDEFEDDEEMQMIPKFSREHLTKEIAVPEEFLETRRRVKKAEPIFIRLDKFEESLHIFDQAKNKIKEIEKLLQDTKRIKEEEEIELEDWEKEIQTLKQQIEKVDKDIFSKVE